MTTVKKQPQRQCIACGEMKNKNELLRILKTVDDEIIIDRTGKKNGRGAYICNSKDCFKKAITSKCLEKSFKMAINSDIYETLAKEMEQLEDR
ncbi:MAG: YlxR family protein [Lachnospiraceae bacterium]|nr:YlxR family protein [Lachnospira sp.]MBR6697397.1 YlxR family protein [Lachnospiraceae bacterium]